jgi:peroxiredoxin Q/BCP
MHTHLQEGQPAPDFDLMDGDGRRHRLPDYNGQRVLLYFYGRDDTPG